MDQEKITDQRSRIKENQIMKIKDQLFTDHESKITDQANQIKKNMDQRSTGNQVFKDQRSKKDQRSSLVQRNQKEII